MNVIRNYMKVNFYNVKINNLNNTVKIIKEKTNNLSYVKIMVDF